MSDIAPKFGRRSLTPHNVLIAITAAGLWGLLAVFAFWGYIDTKPPLKILPQTEESADHAVNPKVVRGGLLMISRNYCIATGRPGTINRQIIDTIVLTYPKADAPAELGCHEGRIHAVEVPMLIPNGSYVFSETVSYELNPITNREVKLPDITFEVVDEPDRPRRQRTAFDGVVNGD